MLHSPDTTTPRSGHLRLVSSLPQHPPTLEFLRVRVDRAVVSIPCVGDGSLSPILFAQARPADAALILAILAAAASGSANRMVSGIARRLAGPGLLDLDLDRLAAPLDARLDAWNARTLDSRGYPVLLLHSVTVPVQQARPARVHLTVGLNVEGYREVLGTSTSTRDAETGWHAHLARLRARDLHGVRLIIAQDSPGLQSALGSHFPAVPWQQCQAQVQEAVLARAPQKVQSELHAALRACFDARSLPAARAALDSARSAYGPEAPAALRYLDETFPHVTTALGLPGAHRLRTVRALSPLAADLRHRQAVVGTFPALEALDRLAIAVAMDWETEWAGAGRYTSVAGLLPASKGH